MAYPYYHLYFGKAWFGPSLGYPVDLKDSRYFRPTYFAYGQYKNFMFHNPESLEYFRSHEKDGCQIETYPTDHWIQVERPETLNHSLNEWLDKTQEICEKKN